jgi:hypothetical protein
MAVDKVFYNQASMAKLGWEPSWFGGECNDEVLVSMIKKWQKKARLVADGMVGPTTYRRIWTERQAFISSYEPNQGGVYDNTEESCKVNNHIVHNGKFYKINWHKVVRWDEPGGLKSNPGNYYDYSGKEDRSPDIFVNHWDVCLSAESCSTVLNRRGISVHFCLDNDGTIYQLLDTQHGAWHAGHGAVNRRSIGVEISNAYYPKYQDWYVKNGFGERPVETNSVVHGKTLKEHLGFYPVQLEALKALWEACHLAFNIPMECPTSPDGTLLLGVDDRCLSGDFKGFVNHYNLTRKKIDCANLEMLKMISECKSGTKL